MSRARLFLTLAAVAAVPLGAPAVAAAAPGNVEVITRAWGTVGAAPYSLVYPTPGVVSDDGRWAAFSAAPRGTPTTFYEGQAPFDLRVGLYVRDVLHNRTIQVTESGFGRATGIDRAGRFISYEWMPPTPDVRLPPATEL